MSHSTGKLMDLVYPSLTSSQPFRQIQTHNMVSAAPSNLLKHPCLHHNVRSAASKSSVLGKGKPPTWLVGELGEWKKRRAPCMCRHAECPGLSSQQGLAYMAVKVVKLGNSMERYFDFRTKRELYLGKQTVDQKVGLRLSQDASGSLSLLGHGCLKQNDVVVLRGVTSGMGCRHGQVMYASSFRPVCAMDYIVTKF